MNQFLIAATEPLLPFAIFPLKTCPVELNDMINDGKLLAGGQETGWIDRKKFRQLTEQFIKWVENRRITKNKKDAPFLLFLDSHGSRMDEEALQKLKEAKIEIVTYPADCTHILQALDVVIFEAFKRHLRNQTRSMRKTILQWGSNYEPTKKSVARAKIILATINALHQATTYTNIVKAFQRSVISPRDVDMALANPFINTSIIEETPTDTMKLSRTSDSKPDMTSKIITSDSFIQEVKEFKGNKKRKGESSSTSNTSVIATDIENPKKGSVQRRD